jgi:hypothetical protein
MLAELAATPIIAEHEAWWKVFVVAVPALAALAALGSVRRCGSERSHAAGRRQRSGLLWLNVGVALVVLLGYMFIGTSRRGDLSAGVDDNFAVANERASRESIDVLWDRLSRPRIELGESDQPRKEMAVVHGPSVGADDGIDVSSMPAGRQASPSLTVAMVKAIADSSRDKAVKHETASRKAPAKAVAPVAASDARSAPTPRPEKPDWVSNPPSLVGNVRKYVVSAGPYETLEECHRALEAEMQQVVAARVNELAAKAGEPLVYFPNLYQLNVGPDYILRELCTDEYVEDVDASVGQMKTAYALLEFTEAQDQFLMDRWKIFARRDRLVWTALMSGLGLGCVALAYGLLKVDTWTRGYYTKRLFLGVPAAIIAVVALVGMLS